jgi:butyrate kinase
LNILVLNPGSTSTRIAVFQDNKCVDNFQIQHADNVLNKSLFPEQYEIRKKEILNILTNKGYKFSDFYAIAARGGRLKPVKSGVYRINKKMVQHAKIGLQGQHPANLAVVMAWDFSREFNIQSFTVDPISVDELEDFVRITGIKDIKRCSLSHALNMKAVAKKASQDIGKKYDSTKLIIVHLGGGGSVSAHLNGKMVDLYNSDKEGAFAVERAGFIPTLDLIEYIEKKGLSTQQVIDKLAHEGGFYSHFGTRDMKLIEDLYDNDSHAKLIMKAYIYNISKSVYSFLPLFKGQVDAVVFTGGVCHSRLIQKLIKEQITLLGRLLWYPGEFEMESLALNTLSVLEGKSIAYEY